MMWLPLHPHSAVMPFVSSSKVALGSWSVSLALLEWGRGLTPIPYRPPQPGPELALAQLPDFKLSRACQAAAGKPYKWSNHS